MRTTIYSWALLATSLVCASCGPAGLTAGMEPVAGFERFRSLLESPVVERVAWYRPGSHRWALLVTEYEGEIDLREAVAARDRQRDRWRYLEVGAARGLDIDGDRALGWPVLQPRSAGQPLEMFVALLPRDGRTFVLELRDGGAEEMATYRHPAGAEVPVLPAVLATVLLGGAAWATYLRRRALLP